MNILLIFRMPVHVKGSELYKKKWPSRGSNRTTEVADQGFEARPMPKCILRGRIYEFIKQGWSKIQKPFSVVSGGFGTGANAVSSCFRAFFVWRRRFDSLRGLQNCG